MVFFFIRYTAKINLNLLHLKIAKLFLDIVNLRNKVILFFHRNKVVFSSYQRIFTLKIDA